MALRHSFSGYALKFLRYSAGFPLTLLLLLILARGTFYITAEAPEFLATREVFITLALISGACGLWNRDFGVALIVAGVLFLGWLGVYCFTGVGRWASGWAIWTVEGAFYHPLGQTILALVIALFIVLRTAPTDSPSVVMKKSVRNILIVALAAAILVLVSRGALNATEGETSSLLSFRTLAWILAISMAVGVAGQLLTERERGPTYGVITLGVLLFFWLIGVLSVSCLNWAAPKLEFVSHWLTETWEGRGFLLCMAINEAFEFKIESEW